MNAERVITRLRQFLFGLAITMCIGVIAELWLTEHYQDPMQWVPLVLCGLGVIGLLLAWFKPNRQTLRALRVFMLIVALGGLLGVYEHLERNLEFAREVKAAFANAQPLWAALTGANPPLAPGALVITALVAVAGTYAHPGLNQKNE
jgi:hypothetical protein